LLFSDLTIGEIAYRTGFRDQLYFSRAFKRNRGAAPSDYRAAQRRENVQTG
jgi:AraC family transcriptional activator of pobA